MADDHGRADPQFMWAWEAYIALRPEKYRGMAPGPVPISAIREYCEFVGIEDPMQRQRLVRLVQAMDRAEDQWRASD